MNERDIERQEQEWSALFERTNATLQNVSEGGDYFILGENWGRHRHEIEIQNLNFLRPVVIKSLQTLLSDYPKWEIAIGVDVVTKYKGWPEMGVIVRSNEIVDGLQREYLPQELQAAVYEGRVRKIGPPRPR
jgi:hypothetical protein